MSDIFLSYVRRDRGRVTPLIAQLRADGYSVWWDDDIPAEAAWEATIEKALADARIVVVCWSAAAVASENVRAEARWAKDRDKLLQLFLEPCTPPLFFGERQGVDLSGWHGNPGDPRLVRLEASIDERIADGHSSAGRAAAADPPARGVGRSRRRIAWVGAAVVLLLLAVGAVLWRTQSSIAPTRATRIAVLPFDVLGGDADTVVFARTLGDQIVAALNSGEMTVLSRSDAATLRGADNATRLKELGVGLFFDGTVTGHGGTLSVQVHVNEPVQHVTLWSGGGTAPVGDVAALRTRIAKTVVGVLACSNRALQANGLTDASLLTRYLHACDLFVNNNDASDPKATFELLDNLRVVTKQAPGFVAAHTDLAKFAAYLAPLMPDTQAAAMRRESAAEATTALAIDPNAPDAWLAREMLLPPSQWAAREALLRRGIAADPAWPHTNGFMAFLLQETGRMNESVVYAAHAAAADLQIDWGSASAYMTCTAGRVDDTLAELRSKLALDPTSSAVKGRIRYCLTVAGRFAEAAALEQPAMAAPGSPPRETGLRLAGEKAALSKAPADRANVRRIALALAEVDLNGKSQAIIWLAQLGFLDDAFAVAKTYRPGYPMTAISDFLFEPRTAPMRRDPRFVQLARDYGLAEFWRTTGRWPDFCADPALPYSCRAVFAKSR